MPPNSSVMPSCPSWILAENLRLTTVSAADNWAASHCDENWKSERRNFPAGLTPTTLTSTSFTTEFGTIGGPAEGPPASNRQGLFMTNRLQPSRLLVSESLVNLSSRASSAERREGSKSSPLLGKPELVEGIGGGSGGQSEALNFSPGANSVAGIWTLGLGLFGDSEWGLRGFRKFFLSTELLSVFRGNCPSCR